MNAESPPNSPNETIHQPIRLRIMAALTAPGAEEGLDFTRLKNLTGATDGNLGAHIDTLTRAGYVEVTKAFVARRPRTTVRASASGRTAFAAHVAFLRAIIAGSVGRRFDSPDDIVI
jgi:DNA-binding MarR family transcriptional regulator